MRDVLALLKLVGAQLDVGLFRHIGALELRAHAHAVEVAGPAADDDRRDAVANQIRDGARLRHKAVNAEDQGEPGDRHVADGRERRASTMKPLPVTPAAPFDVSSSTNSSVISWVSVIGVLVAWARGNHVCDSRSGRSRLERSSNDADITNQGRAESPSL